MTDQIVTREIRHDTLIGSLSKPTSPEPAPGVLLIGGSEGGRHERDAQLLAAEGFTVLALAYFGLPGLPPGLMDIPLELFFGGIDVLTAEPNATGRVGVTGGSRGGEAALLVAAHDTRVNAVVGGCVAAQRRRRPQLAVNCLQPGLRRPVA